jgi:hypothetical protein
MGWMAEKSRFDSWQRQKFSIFSTASRLTLGPTQPPIQWMLGALSLGFKQLERESDHSLLSSAKIKNCRAIPSLPHMYSWRGT